MCAWPAALPPPAGYGRLALVRLLLERGAELGAANGKQQTPADVARLNGEVRAGVQGAEGCMAGAAHQHCFSKDDCSEQGQQQCKTSMLPAYHTH